jgi:hypothetical protein
VSQPAPFPNVQQPVSVAAIQPARPATTAAVANPQTSAQTLASVFASLGIHEQFLAPFQKEFFELDDLQHRDLRSSLVCCQLEGLAVDWNAGWCSGGHSSLKRTLSRLLQAVARPAVT